MAGKNTVLRSFNAHGEGRCMNVFVRPDGTFGFEEFRRDPEDSRGWFPVGSFGERIFHSKEAALSEAT